VPIYSTPIPVPLFIYFPKSPSGELGDLAWAIGTEKPIQVNVKEGLKNMVFNKDTAIFSMSPGV
jgi:hypothetical protein